MAFWCTPWPSTPTVCMWAGESNGSGSAGNCECSMLPRLARESKPGHTTTTSHMHHPLRSHPICRTHSLGRGMQLSPSVTLCHPVWTNKQPNEMMMVERTCHAHEADDSTAQSCPASLGRAMQTHDENECSLLSHRHPDIMSPSFTCTTREVDCTV